MRVNKILVYVLVLGGELTGCVVLYYTHPQGNPAVTLLTNECMLLESKNREIIAKNGALEKRSTLWGQYPAFFREKIAREELQMAYPNDELFIIL